MTNAHRSLQPQPFGVECSTFDLQSSFPLKNFFPDFDFFEQTGFDGQRVQVGLDHICDNAADPVHLLNEALYIAFLREDKTAARRYLEKLEPHDVEWAVSLWLFRSQYDAVKRWVSRE